MYHNNRTNISALVLHMSWLGLAAISGCSEDTVPVYDVDCGDDAIGWPLDLPNLVELPPAEFAVECASGWGHEVETRAANEVVNLPSGCKRFVSHPQGGLLLLVLCEEALWSEHLGIEVVSGSLAWVDEQVGKIRWLRDDLEYGDPNVVTVEGKTELWVWGNGDGPDYVDYLSRIDLSTGELLGRVVLPEPFMGSVAAWPQDGGLWQVTVESHEDFDNYMLQRMSSFAELGPVLSTFKAPHVPLEGTFGYGITPPDLRPTPGGGLLFGTGKRLESLAEDGSVRWVLEEPHTSRVVDEHGGFLLGNVSGGGGPHGQQYGLAIQRRKLDDASLLWTRVHHRYLFAHEPKPGQYLDDTAWSYVARADGGYLIGGGHAYPASSCPWQPVLWAIDIDGEVEWAHRVEACGDFFIPGDRVEGRALVLGSSYANGDSLNSNIQAHWLQYLDL